MIGPGAGLTVTLAFALLLPAPLAAQAPRGTVPRIGLLDNASPAARAHLWEAFRQGMRELGYVEGRSVIFEARSADGKYERLPALAADLVRLKVDLIMTSGTATAAARGATATIPIVSASVNPLDPTQVASFGRPGGNVTGLTTLSVELSAKRFDLARELAGGTLRIAILWAQRSAGATSSTTLRETEAVARSHGVSLHAVGVKSPTEFDSASRRWRRRVRRSSSSRRAACSSATVSLLPSSP